MSGKAPGRRVTIADVARAAGVSPTTVSFVMQGRGRISEKTAAAVRRTIDELGYVYDRNAAALRKRSSRLVGLVIHDLGNPYFAEVAAGVEEVLGEAGYLPVIGNSREDRARQKALMVSMGEHGVAGFIISAAVPSEAEDLGVAQAASIPCVFCVRDPRLAQFDYVGTDDCRGAQLAMEHLVERGHRRIAFVGGLRGAGPRVDRFAAYGAALDALEESIDERLVVACPPTREAGREAAGVLRRVGADFTAALCYNDVVAFGFCMGLRDVGLAPGADVAVVGFDNLPESEAWTPALTSVETFPRTTGREAAQLLLRRLEEPDAEAACVRRTPRLIVRDSTAAGGAPIDRFSKLTTGADLVVDGGFTTK